MAKGRRGRKKTNKWIRHLKKHCAPSYWDQMWNRAVRTGRIG